MLPPTYQIIPSARFECAPRLTRRGPESFRGNDFFDQEKCLQRKHLRMVQIYLTRKSLRPHGAVQRIGTVEGHCCRCSLGEVTCKLQAHSDGGGPCEPWPSSGTPTCQTTLGSRPSRSTTTLVIGRTSAESKIRCRSFIRVLPKFGKNTGLPRY